MNKLYTFYRYQLASLQYKRNKVLSIISLTHQVIHSSFAAIFRVPSLPHKKVVELYFYYFFFPLMMMFPNPICGWYFLHVSYGAGYYKYRLTLIGLVDNFRVVPLHAWGYMQWRTFWRERAYPRLVKKFPRWGYFTTLAIWSQHFFIGHGLTKFFGAKFLSLLNSTLALRYSAPRLNTKPKLYGQVQDLRSLQNTVDDSLAADVLVDQEVLSLDNVFPFPRFEPFQEESLGYFEDQQDMTHEEDEEPNQNFDIQYGTNEGAYLMEEDEYLFMRETRHRRRRPNRLSRKPQPYREVTSEVTSFTLKLDSIDFSGKKVFTLGRLLDAGQGPAEIDEEPDFEVHLPDDEEALPWERREELADWFFLSLRTNNLTDSDLFHTEYTGSLWRIYSNLWVPGVLSRPFRHYSTYRGWKRWWWYSRRLQARHYYKEMKAAGKELLGYRYYYRPAPPTVSQLRRQARIKHKRKATFKTENLRSRQVLRRWWGSSRRCRQDTSFFSWEYIEDFGEAFIDRRYFRKFRQASRQWRKASRNWFRTNSGRDSFLVSLRFRQRRQFLLQFPEGFSGSYRWGTRRRALGTHFYKHRRKWVYNRYAKIVRSKKKPAREQIRLVYPRYQPAYSIVTASAGSEVNEPGMPFVSLSPPTGFMIVATAVVVSVLFALVPELSREYIHETWSFEVAEVGWQKAIGTDFSYREVPKGLLSWIEVYRSAPPRGFPLTGYPASVDANIYVWSWFADFWSTSWRPQNEDTVTTFQLVSHSHWKWFRDPSKRFGPSWPPYLPSWQHLDRVVDTHGATPLGLERREKPESLRLLNTQYYKMEDVKRWMWSQVADLEDRNGNGQFMWNVWWDTTQLTWAHHFANPFWVNPRNLFPQQGHQLDSRYLRFWDVLTQIYNQSCDDGMYRQSFYNLGRTDETLMWPHRIEHLSPGWVVFNLPQGWETHWNQRLIQDWTNNANFLLEKYRDKLDSSVWVNELWLRFTHTVYRCCFSEQALWKILRLGFFIVGATSFFRPLLFSYRTAIQTLETGVTVKQEGISREIPSCFLENKNPRAATYQIGAPFPGMSMLSYQRLHNKLFVHSDTPNSEKYEFGQVRSPSWRWNPYDYHFTTYRRHPLWSRFSTGQRYRRGFLQAAESGFFPMGKKPDSALLDQNFSDLPPVKDYYRVSSPVLPLVGRVWFSAQAVPRQELRCDTSANKLKWSQPALAKSTSLWLVAQPTRIFEVSEPGGIDFPEWRGQSIRASRRRKRRENRPITSYNVRPQQYRKIHRRYVDDSVRQNPRHSPSEELFSFVKTGVTTPLLQLRNQRTINQRRWWEIPKVTSIGVTPVKLNPVEQLFLDQLVEVNYPGRCKGKLHRRATPASTGTNWGLYHEDYNNEPFYGHQGDDETVELEDAENPLLSYNNLASVTGVPNASVVWPRTQTSHPTSRNLVSWSRWCGLPLSWYGRPQLGVTQTYQSGWIFERCYWSPIASDHPAAEISSLLVTYDIPRFYRRLTRWFDFVPPKARHALYRDPWGNTSAATSDRVGSGGVVNRPYKAKARRISRILQRHGGGDGGDLSSWPSVGIYLWDELQQTGWGPRTKHHNDNLEATEVGTAGELPHVDHTYRGYLRRGWGYRTSFVSWITHSEGINLDGGSSGGDIQSSDLPLEVDPEQVLLAWWSPPYWVDGYDEEELWLDDYMFERDPEDGFDHPAEEEHNSEVARSEPRDLPGWVVAAAVAGTADPLEALHDGAAEGVELAPGTRVWGSNPNFIRFYYRHWLRHKRQPLWWGSRLSWGGDGVNAKLVHEKLEISGGVGPVDPGIEGNPLWANVDDHIRVWALTEIYLRDRPCGWASPV